MCKEAGGGGEGARDTESKTRTPHKVVGKKRLECQAVAMHDTGVLAAKSIGLFVGTQTRMCCR